MKEDIFLLSSFQALIDNAVQKTVNAALDRFERRMSFMLSEHSESFEFFESSENSDVENDTTSSKWNASEIELFDSNFDGKSVITKSAIEHSEKNTYYRNVHVFVERFRQMIIILESELMRRNLSFCLCEIALNWHTVELTNDNRRLLIYDNEIDEWVRKLIERFKESSSIVIITLLRERYIMKDARRNREPREYAQMILRAAKSVEMISIFNQLYAIYNELNVKFQRNLMKSIQDTIVNSFFNNWMIIRKSDEHLKEDITQISNRRRKNILLRSLKWDVILNLLETISISICRDHIVRIIHLIIRLHFLTRDLSFNYSIHTRTKLISHINHIRQTLIHSSTLTSHTLHLRSRLYSIQSSSQISGHSCRHPISLKIVNDILQKHISMNDRSISAITLIIARIMGWIMKIIETTIFRHNKCQIIKKLTIVNMIWNTRIFQLILKRVAKIREKRKKWKSLATLDECVSCERLWESARCHHE